MDKRLIDFQIIKNGLQAYLDGRYCREVRQGIIHEMYKEQMEILSNKSGIPLERLRGFYTLAHKVVYDYGANESDYPTSVEFDKMMFVDYCDKEDAIHLQKKLDEEFRIFIKEKQQTS